MWRKKIDYSYVLFWVLRSRNAGIPVYSTEESSGNSVELGLVYVSVLSRLFRNYGLRKNYHRTDTLFLIVWQKEKGILAKSQVH